MLHLPSPEILGPQRRTDAPFARRLRFHQSWYRVAVLGRPTFGRTPGAAGGPLGSVLAPADAEAGLNFTSHHARSLYSARRVAGWGVDPNRCKSLMTSSQAMMFNFLGPLAADRAWLLRTVASLLRRTDLIEVLAIDPEFAPTRRSEHLGDQTRIDLLLTVSTASGDEIVALELKYMDRFSTRRVDTTREPYRIIAREADLWRDPNSVLGSAQFNQLVRVHALAASVARRRGIDAPITFLAIGHKGDVKTWTTLDDYREQMALPERLVVATLNGLLDAMSSSALDATQLRQANDLRRRYVNEHESDAAWSAFGPAGD